MYQILGGKTKNLRRNTSSILHAGLSSEPLRELTALSRPLTELLTPLALAVWHRNSFLALVASPLKL